MHFMLFLVTLERFGHVSYKRYIDLFFDYRYSDPITAVLLSVLTPITVTTAEAILIQTPIPQTYREISGTTVNTVPMRVSNMKLLQ